MDPSWLVVDRRNPRAVEAGARLVAALPDDLPDDLPTVVLGGDGFLLRTVAGRHFEGIFLGMNAGNLGFLHNDVDQWEEAAWLLAEGRWAPHHFPLLRAEAELAGGGRLSSLAMNDVYLERSTGQAARLAVYVDGTEVVENLVADGIIVATALGSTAYSYSAGGSPAHPLAQVLKVTPICPHLPRLSSFDLPYTAKIRVEVRLGERRPVRAVIDGQATESAVTALDVETSAQSVTLAYLEGHDFTAHLLDKIVRP